MNRNRITLYDLCVWLTLLCLFPLPLFAEDGSRLWLRQEGRAAAQVLTSRRTPTAALAVDELKTAWQGDPVRLVVKKDKTLAADGFRVQRTADNRLTVISPTDAGLLYAAYHLLRLQATDALPVGNVWEITENPAFTRRLLNHWDNMDRTVERGYAGASLWEWDALPDSLSPRYEAYARANASIGINGTVLNNVNASPYILSTANLQKVKALADLFRPYALRVYLSVNFASPQVLGGLSTSDPLNEEVAAWWRQKVKEIYRLIPDFGGFLVKANSEGQPGPCDYGRTHAEGANLLADALAPYDGIVLWRAFVYSPNDADRAKQAYAEFKPLDGDFRSNVIVQIKNGPVDFQPCEPYSPLFGAMPHTPLMVEFQITQEYLGHSNHIAYLAPMWKEFYSFVEPNSLAAVAGVANIGTSTDWCGHPFAQANWYAFGRLAWNPALTSEAIADEWLLQTFGDSSARPALPSSLLASLRTLMVESREAVVDYMMPLGLHHLFAWNHHYGPEPWCAIEGARPDWLPTYYHRADQEGIGFDRTRRGSGATTQYPDSLARLYDDVRTCPEEYLLWFHHVPWSHPMQSGRTLWQELCHHYDRGVQQVRRFQQLWEEAAGVVDAERFEVVQAKLKTQVRDAVWWKDACLLYFQTFSGMPFPSDMELPIHTLEQLKQVTLPISNYESPDASLLNRWR